MKKVSRRDILAVFWIQTRPYKWRLIFVVALIMVAYLCEALVPWAGKILVDRLSEADVRSWNLVFYPFAALIGLSLGDWLFRRLSDSLATTVRPNMTDLDARRMSFDALIARPYAFFVETPAGSATRYIDRFSQALGETFEQVVYNLLRVVMLVGTIIVSLAFRSWILATGFAVWTVAFVFVQWKFSKRQETLRLEVAAADAAASGRVADAIGNAVTVKAFASETREAAGIVKALDVFVRKEKQAWFSEERYWAVQSFFFVVLEFALIWYILDGWTKGQFTLGDFVLVQASSAILFHPLADLGRVFRRLPRMFTYAADIVALKNTPPEIVDAPGAKPFKAKEGAIIFDGVSFRYKEGRPVLKDFSLRITPKEKVAFVGPSGAGKSTVVKILLRFYDSQKGTIEIDGQDIARCTQESVRRNIALVPQDPALFHRSIADNIRYARPSASDKEVIASAKRAHCHEFISRLPDGYESMVGERGVKLSGGERQRVAIARAILADTPILVLDEATSSLDSESEALIQDALHELMRDKTVLVIAHRLSTIMEMDRIIVMENGKVSAQGTHQQLVKRAGTYKRLWNLQSGGYITE